MSYEKLTNRVIIKILNECATNIATEFSMYYPNISQINHEYYITLKQFTLARLRKLLGEGTDGDYKQALISMTKVMDVNSYSKNRNAEVAYDLNFDELCNSMNKEYHGDVRKLTIRGFYSLFEHIRKGQRSTQGKKDKFL